MSGTLYERAAVAATRRRRRAAFSMRSLPGLVFWGQAESVTKDGSNNVSALLDLSGAGVVAAATQGTTANMPLWVANGLNGRPVLRFNGTTHHLIADALAASFTGSDSPFTIIAAGKINSLAAAGALVGYGSSVSGTPFGYVGAFGPTSPRWLATRRDDANVSATVSNGTTDPADTNAAVLSWVFPGTAMTHRKGGVVILDSIAMDVGVLTLDRLTIGARRELAASTFWNGDVAEIAICAGALSAANCLAAERAMGKRSGLVVA